MTNKITKNAQDLLERKYLKDDEVSYDEMARRVARYIANTPDEVQMFYNILLKNRNFLPNSPVLMNANTDIGYLSACNVAPIDDDMHDIFETLKKATLIQKSGGGMGFSFNRLRPSGDKVGSTGKYSSGPISFMYAYDEATNTVKQGGKRRGANMGILRIDHPNILEFIKAKGELNERNQILYDKVKEFIDKNKKEYFKQAIMDSNQLPNFNISVAVTDEFVEAVENKEKYELINPRNNKVWGTLYAPDVWDVIIEYAHKNGEPGLMFIDEVNRQHPAPEWIESLNVCGEQPLLPWESCLLGAINLSNILLPINPKGYKKNQSKYKINYDKLEKIIRTAVRFLDNCIDKNEYPVPELEKAAKKYRKIGIGVMGWAELLIKLNIRYGSEESLDLAVQISEFINAIALDQSNFLAHKKGIPEAIKDLGLERRNLVLTNAAPTGSRAFIANTSGGIEPFYSFKYTHTDAEGNISEFKYDFIDEADKDVLVTANDVTPEEHVKMQAAWQKYLGAAVSKTVNLPADATKEDVDKVYKMAYETNCKGITIFRDGSKTEQVLEDKSNNNKTSTEPKKAKQELPRGYVEDAKKIAKGTRYKSQSGCGTCYSTIVNDEKKIIETFIETKNGGCKASTEAMSRLISLCLRGGIDVERVIDQLHSVSPCIAYTNKDDTDKGTSCPDMIGHKLEKEKKKLKNQDISKIINETFEENEERTEDFSKSIESFVEKNITIDDKDKCPECGAELNKFSGCLQCNSCGWSKCG